MNHRWARSHELDWSSGQGYVETAYEHLVAEFGDPVTNVEKSQVYWRTTFEDGTVASLYDWKCDCDPRRHRIWNVGGFDERALDRVARALGPRAKIWTEERPFV